ncbi:MAG: hypothetical protein QW177_07375 [Candidatus Nitrosotenuis sp.]
MEDKAKIAENLFSPDISAILAELEDGAKESSYLEEKLGISQDEIKTRLAYLLETGFVTVTDSPIMYAVNNDKLAKFMENDENYKGVVDGLTELDSYLN